MTGLGELGATGLVGLAVLIGALAQSVSGIGFALVSGPLLVAVLGPHEGVRLSVLLSLLVNLAVLARTGRLASARDALLLLAPAALATPVWVRLLRQAPERTAAALAGLATLLGVCALAAGLRWRAAGGRAGAVGAGIVSAAMNVVAGVGGPAVALYAANAGWPAAALRSTGQLYFFGLNLLALVALGLPSVAGSLLITCGLGLVVGLLGGAALTSRVSERAARRCTLGLAGLGGLAVLVHALS